MKTIIKARPIAGLGLLLLLTFFWSQAASAQSCAVRIHYIIRDSKGHVIDASTLKPSDFVNERAHYWRRYTEEISFSATGNVKDEAKVTSLSYQDGGNCKLTLDELTLRMGGKTMHLIFNLGFEGGTYFKSIDSLPFKQGTFRLEATSENNIPASSWKKVSNKP